MTRKDQRRTHTIATHQALRGEQVQDVTKIETILLDWDDDYRLALADTVVLNPDLKRTEYWNRRIGLLIDWDCWPSSPH